MLQAAVEPTTVAGVALTSSVFPAVPRAIPHPLVVGVFSVYGSPRVGDWFVRKRFREMDPEQVVRAGFAMLPGRPRSIPEEMIVATIELERRRRADPDAAEAFLGTARSMLRLGRRPDVAARALDGVRCPVLVLHGRRDRFVPIAWAEAAVAVHPEWRFRFFPDLGHVPQLEAPGRWLTAVADWYAETIA